MGRCDTSELGLPSPPMRDVRTGAVAWSVAVLVLASSCTASNPCNATNCSGDAGDSGASWVRQFGQIGPDTASAVALDSQSNVYVVGSTAGRQLSGHNQALQDDVFLRKYDSSGTEQWVRLFGEPDLDEEATGVAVDAAGNVLVLGTLETARRSDVFLRKYDPAGNVLWSQETGSPSGDPTVGLAVDAAGNAYVAGYTYGALPGQTHVGDSDLFLMKFDPGGGAVWTRQFGTPAADRAKGISIDPAGNVVVLGWTLGVFPGHTPPGPAYAFVRQYDSSGGVLWTRQLPRNAGAIAAGEASSLIVMGHGYVENHDANGNVVWSGTFAGDGVSAISAGSGNVLVAVDARATPDGQTVLMYDSSGTQVSSWMIGLPSPTDFVTGIAVTQLGRLFACGSTVGVFPGETWIGLSDAFVMRTHLRAPVP